MLHTFGDQFRSGRKTKNWPIQFWHKNYDQSVSIHESFFPDQKIMSACVFSYHHFFSLNVCVFQSCMHCNTINIEQGVLLLGFLSILMNAAETTTAAAMGIFTVMKLMLLSPGHFNIIRSKSEMNQSKLWNILKNEEQMLSPLAFKIEKYTFHYFLALKMGHGH